MVAVHGRGFAEYNAHCLVGGSTLVKATVSNSSALLCRTPSMSSASGAAIEVTLNGDTSAHTLTSDEVLKRGSAVVQIFQKWIDTCRIVNSVSEKLRTEAAEGGDGVQRLGSTQDEENKENEEEEEEEEEE